MDKEKPSDEEIDADRAREREERERAAAEQERLKGIKKAAAVRKGADAANPQI